MLTVLNCLQVENDGRLLFLAAIVCIVGVYGSFSIAKHASRSAGRARAIWAWSSVLASGCTAWATHMIALLAFQPGMEAGFDPILTILSLLLGVVGIGTGLALAVGRQKRPRRFAAGTMLGVGVGALHYVGQASYVVRGEIAWDFGLVATSLLISLPISGLALVAAGERRK
ncbi:MAG: bifunctional diguanylate cyclase/phosphodiesterase, partial [Zymomonas sp.]